MVLDAVLQGLELVLPEEGEGVVFEGGLGEMVGALADGEVLGGGVGGEKDEGGRGSEEEAGGELLLDALCPLVRDEVHPLLAAPSSSHRQQARLELFRDQVEGHLQSIFLIRIPHSRHDLGVSLLGAATSQWGLLCLLVGGGVCAFGGWGWGIHLK